MDENTPNPAPSVEPVEPTKVKTVRKESWAPTVKWLFICLTMCLFTLILYKAYRVVTAPVRGISGAAELIKDQTSSVSNRLDVALKKPKSFSQLSEEAFNILIDYPVQKPTKFGETLFWAQHLRGSNGQVCAFKLNFGDGEIPVYTAANNSKYQTAKAVGSLQDRIIRVHLLTGGDEIGLRSYWDDEAKKWKMRWRRLTFSKPLNDEGAQKTLRQILSEIPERCVIRPAASPQSE